MRTVGKSLPGMPKLVGKVGRKTEYSNNLKVSAPKYLLIIQGNIVQLHSGGKPVKAPVTRPTDIMYLLLSDCGPALPTLFELYDLLKVLATVTLGF